MISEFLTESTKTLLLHSLAAANLLFAVFRYTLHTKFTITAISSETRLPARIKFRPAFAFIGPAVMIFSLVWFLTVFHTVSNYQFIAGISFDSLLWFLTFLGVGIAAIGICGSTFLHLVLA